MDRSKLGENLLSSHKQLMKLVELDSPQVDFRAQIESISGKSATFSIISTSTKIKVEKMLEEKIFIKTRKGDVEGTVTEAYSSNIVVYFNSKIKEKEGAVVVLRTCSNYNNEVILKAAENFFSGDKVINEAIYKSYCESEISNHRIINMLDLGDYGSSHMASYAAKEDKYALSKKNFLKDIKNTEDIGDEPINKKEYCKNDKFSSSDTQIDKECNMNVQSVFNQSRNSSSSQNHELDNLTGLNKVDTVLSEISPSGNAHISDNDLLNDRTVEFFNKNLNRSQQLCVSLSKIGTPYKILGPPGTGKTETVVEIISQALVSKMSVLVCGPSNISIDNIISRFMQSPYFQENNTKFYRLGSAYKGLVNFNLEKMAADAVSFMEREDNDTNFIKELMQRKNEFTKEYKKDCKLVFSTLFSSLKENHFFDLCIVDEACQGTLLECFLSITKAKNFILVGDPNQLCPASSSLYNHLDVDTVILNEQYRMPRDLIEFSNGHFYCNQIISAKNEEFFFINNFRILFVDTSYFGYQEEEVDQSRINHKEALLVQAAVEWLIRQGHEEIGVITPYSAQVRMLRDLTNVQVETVDGFQGQERDFIVLSLVRSNEESEIGFLRDKKRLNVAITRAKKGLIVIADSSNFTKDKFLRQFFKFLNCNSEVMDPETFLQFCRIQ